MSVHRYSMGNRDLVLVTDDDDSRCRGLGRYSARCKRRGLTHPTRLCTDHRHQDYVCASCKSGLCETHDGGAA